MTQPMHDPTRHESNARVFRAINRIQGIVRDDLRTSDELIDTMALVLAEHLVRWPEPIDDALAHVTDRLRSACLLAKEDFEGQPARIREEVTDWRRTTTALRARRLRRTGESLRDAARIKRAAAACADIIADARLGLEQGLRALCLVLGVIGHMRPEPMDDFLAIVADNIRRSREILELAALARPAGHWRAR
jgi:hypothetical protein